MPEFRVNVRRLDPYKNFKFKIKWASRYVAGFSKVRALKLTTEVVDYRSDADSSFSRKLPSQSKFEAVTLERGMTNDPEFVQWANKVWNDDSALDNEVSHQDIREDLIIEMYNEAGQLVVAYKVFRCWVSAFQVTPEIDASTNEVAIQTLKLENEGWERDV